MEKRELISSKAITAAIEYTCERCGKKIKKGAVCRRVVILQDKRDISTIYECWGCWGKSEEHL